MIQWVRGISLNSVQWDMASSGDDWATTWLFSTYGGILELRPGTQRAPRVAPGKINLHSK